ncbi:DUF1643 domain-containing protein [Paenibacillus luteus]|uniref:DUF1643 domain-containing protein n=1 Tax=Paenibacillus luteus TaxID=2545753 RepID=UPI0013754A8B|nr:DUF1643 domain-containing protein [Paenibacillus luteus]
MKPRIVEKAIVSTAIFSDNDDYRYRLTRVWDKDKKLAALVMLNPSKATELKSDQTVMNMTNFLVDNDYGGIEIVNLFAYMTTPRSGLKNRSQEYEKYNDDYIIQGVNSDIVEIIIVGWGSDNTEHVRRKRQVEKMLLPYREKLKCFQDKDGKQPRHPAYYSEMWTLVDYNFVF